MQELDHSTAAVQALHGHSLTDIESWMLQQEQAPYETRHHFGPGVYIREATLPAGALVMGHAHRNPCLNVMLKGAMAVLIDGEVKVIEGPATFMSPAGRKLAYIIEATTIQNVFATEETDIDKLEDTLVDKSDTWSAHELEASTQLLLAPVGEVV
jgi:hypothetical protein